VDDLAISRQYAQRQRRSFCIMGERSSNTPSWGGDNRLPPMVLAQLLIKVSSIFQVIFK
jgi:hypothetical protein